MGQGAHDTLNVYDQGSNSTYTYTLTSTPTTSTVQRLGAAAITYDNTAETVTVYGSNGADTYIVQSPSPIFPVTLQAVQGTGTVNTLVGPNQPNTFWIINGQDSGLLGLVTFTGMQNLVGGGSSNTFFFSSAGAISDAIDGGSNLTNTLDYSVTNKAVAVDLEVRSAAHIRGGAANGFSHISSLVGSPAFLGSFTGPNATNLWQLTGANQGNVGSFHFRNIDALLGGSG